MTPSAVKNALPDIEDNDDPFCVLTPDFISGCTDFPNFAQFIDESPWKIEQGEIVTDNGEDVELDQFNQYVSEESRFNGWAQLIDAATKCWDSDLTPEERARKRRHCHVEPIVVEHSYEQGEGTLLDISVRGAGIKTPLNLPGGSWVKITIPKKHVRDVEDLPNRTLQLRGLVRWSGKEEGETRAGIELTARLL